MVIIIVEPHYYNYSLPPKPKKKTSASNQKSSWPEHYTLFRQRDLYRIATELIYEIFNAIS